MHENGRRTIIFTTVATVFVHFSWSGDKKQLTLDDMFC